MSEERNPFSAILISLVAVVLIVAALAIGVGVIVNDKANQLADTQRQLAATQKRQENTQRIALAISARSDCKSELNSWFDAVRSSSNTLSNSLDQQRAAVQLQALDGVPVSDEQISEGQRTSDDLQLANIAVGDLPNLTKAANNGWVPSMETVATVPEIPTLFAPCPKVEGQAKDGG